MPLRIFIFDCPANSIIENREKDKKKLRRENKWGVYCRILSPKSGAFRKCPCSSDCAVLY
jgi:hypothetical protein